MRGIVYVLTNPSYDGLVKIGYTRQTVQERMRSIDGPGVPDRFYCAGAWEFENAKEVERTLHLAFADHRHKKNREFFQLDPERVLVLLQQFGLREVTTKERVTAVETSVPISVTETEKLGDKTDSPPTRRPAFRFAMVPEIKRGDELTSAYDQKMRCIVKDDTKVRFEGEDMSLTAAAQRVLDLQGRQWKAVQGTVAWMWGDPPRSLAQLRDEAEGRL